MSQLNVKPVLLCRRCGRPLVVSHLSTTNPDPDGRELHALSQNISKIALCEFHRRQRDWYIMQGRGEDWEKGRL